MPRRIYTYEPGRGWEIWNLIVTIGVVFQIAGVVAFVFNLLWSLVKGESAGNDSGRVDAGVVHEFTSTRIQFRQIPVVRSRRPRISSIRKIWIG